MRRWMMWAIGGVVLVALGVALFNVPPAPPYEFLRGRQAMDLKLSAPSLTLRGKLPPKTLVYSFKADYDSVCTEAARELGGLDMRRTDGASSSVDGERR